MQATKAYKFHSVNVGTNAGSTNVPESLALFCPDAAPPETKIAGAISLVSGCFLTLTDFISGNFCSNSAVSGQELAGQQYRYQRFTTNLLLRDLRFRTGAVGPGDEFPAFNLVTTAGDRLTNQHLLGKKPILVIFGSVTCPMTASAMPFLQRLYNEFGDQVELIMLNVREAHPGEHFRQPATMTEKLDRARTLKQVYKIPWTVASDDIEGSLHRALDPKPNAAFLVNSDGMVVFRSLWSSDQKAIRQALRSVIGGRVPDKPQSQALFGPVVRAMGYVQAVINRAGPQAVRDLWCAALPMAMVGRIATFFTPLSPDQRGIAAVLSLTLGVLLIMALIDISLIG